MRIVFCLLISIFLFGSCQSDVKKERINTYFDISGFFAAESARLKADNTQLEKRIRDKDGIRKSNETSINWDKELAFFSENDINKPAWKDSYSIQRSIVDSIEILTYTAKNPKLSIREICIRKQLQEGLIEMRIRKRTTNNLYTSFQTLIYAPSKGYFVVGNQNIRLLGTSSYIVNVVFN